MAKHDGYARRAEADEVDQDQQRDADDDAGDQDRQPGDGADCRSERRAAVEIHVGNGDAAERRARRGDHSDDQTVGQSAGQRRIAVERLIPTERKTLQWKRRLDGIVEGKQRDQKDRQIEEHQIGKHVEAEPAAACGGIGARAAHVRLPNLRSAPRARRITQRMTSITQTESAAPNGQSLALPNCDWISVPIMVLAGPPTMAGVT